MSSNSESRSITILYFAAASTVTKRTEELVALPHGSFFLSSLPKLLVARYPDTDLEKVLECSQWSVNAEMVDDPQTIELKGGDEVAVICPVSGG